MPLTLVRHRFSVDDYEHMIRYGILTENDRVELIRGEIIDKMSIGDRHAACVNRLNRLLQRAVGDSAIVSVQNPVRLADSMPEPDVALLRPREDFYAGGAPEPADVHLLVEVADTTVEFDRDVKLPLYAAAGIAECWIVNLADAAVETHRRPLADGRYGETETRHRGQSLALAGLPGWEIGVDQIL